MLTALLKQLEPTDVVQVITNKSFYFGAFFIVFGFEGDRVWVYEIITDKRLVFRRVDLAFIGKTAIKKNVTMEN